MKRRDFVVLVLAVALFGVLTPPASLFAQQGKHHRYKLLDLGTFGGPQSYVNVPDTSYARVLNNHGMVAGWADTRVPDPYPDFCFDGDCLVAHAFRWQREVRSDLGVLPGGASSRGNWISGNGLIAGVSENGQLDPLVPGFPEFRAVLWRNREIIDLGTIGGGYESIATSVNSRGQVVGFATNTIPDPDSMFGLGFQTRAFLWQDGAMQDLGTLGTGTNAMAMLINEKGQIAGNSYTSAEPSSLCAEEGLGSFTTGAFLWNHGTLLDLGNFGGSCTFVSDLNNRGQVVGGSRLAGDLEQHPFLWNGSKLIDLGTFGGGLGNAIAVNDGGEAAGWATYPGDQVFHAALWSEEGMSDLGTLPGDVNSFVADINAGGEVIGYSADSTFTSFRAFLWEKGHSLLNLESVLAGSGLQLGFGIANINDRGEIEGNAIDANNNLHAILLVPCDANDSNCEDASADPEFRPTPAMAKPAINQSNAIRHAPRHPLKPRYEVSVPSAFATPNVWGPAEGGPTKTSDSMPNLLDSLDADRIRFSTTSSCTLYGRPCSPSLTRCCGTLHCVFSGGSTRVSYACK